MDHSIPLPHLSQSDHHSSVHTKYTTALVRTHGHRCEKYTISNSNTYVKMLSIDFSSAFNTNIPSKLGGLGINNSLCILALDSPTNRRRFVRLDSHMFSTLTLNTGVPQCCVLSSLLYSPPMNLRTLLSESVGSGTSSSPQRLTPYPLSALLLCPYPRPNTYPSD